MTSFYENKDFVLYKGDTFHLLEELDEKVDMIFADPPYFLSNGGPSISSGRIVSVNKGDWDIAHSPVDVDVFNKQWLQLCWDKLKDDGTIWVTGTFHNIFSVGKILTELGYKIINFITWEKKNPPYNIFETHFQFSSEYLIWAKKDNKHKHCFNQLFVKESNGGKMLKDVWRLPAVGNWEKKYGRHPTQKPLSLLTRIILSSTHEHSWILDPFCGSGTTGIAASLYGRYFCGIELDDTFCELSKKRRIELDSISISLEMRNKINRIIRHSRLDNVGYVSEEIRQYKNLPF